MYLRSLLVIVTAASAASSAVVLACHATGPGPTPPITSGMLDAGGDAKSDVGDAETDGQTGVFFICTFDSDCVPVPKNSCCDNGFMEAVNTGSVDAYKASFTCPTKQVCPMFRVVDSRIAHCTPDTHKCELVRPDGGRELPTPR
jgi:hypothetical protein